MRLSLEPQHITPWLWYYEEPEGLNFVIEMRDEFGRYMRTEQVTVPWGKIRRSLKRKDSKD